MQVAEKTCPGCEQTRKPEEFYYSKGKRDTYCKPCRRTRTQKWADANPGKRRAKDRRWKSQNRERATRNMRTWARANRAASAAIESRHRRRYPDKASARKALQDAVRDGRIDKPS